MQDNISTISEARRRRHSSITLPARLKVDYEKIVDVGTAKASLASSERIDKLTYADATKKGHEVLIKLSDSITF
jgi:hypothetical protein